VAEEEEIGPSMEMGETMMLGLRLIEGVSDARFRDRFGVSLEAAFGSDLADLRGLGLLEWDGQAARLTPRGRLLGNVVFARFLPD
jgi:oxygen-independent coproporphyrinogen-3 oxidase